MRKIVFIVFILTIYSYSTAFCQETTNEKYQWELYKEVDGVKIFSKIHECHDHKYDLHKEYILLKFVNNNEKDVSINWKNHLWFDGKCTTCDIDNDEYNFNLIITSGETIIGDCNTKDQKLKIFKQFMNYRKSELSKFELVDIKVNEL